MKVDRNASTVGRFIRKLVYQIGAVFKNWRRIELQLLNFELSNMNVYYIMESRDIF